MRIPIVNSAYKGQSVNLTAQRCINLYPIVEGDDTKSPSALVGTPGLTLFSTTGGSPARGIHGFDNQVFIAADTNLYSMLANGIVSQVGTLLTSSGRVSMADNGTQLIIVDGVHGYVYNKNTAVFTQISAPGFPTCDSVVFIDGYFVVNQSGTGTFNISAAYDGLTWDALDFATAEGDPDKIVAVINSHRDLWLLGEKSIEVWSDTGAANFPFERLNGVFIEYGCAAPLSICRADSSLFWVAKDRNGRGYVVRADGYTPTAISTAPIEHEINRYADISAATGYIYRESGHTFYVLTFPSGDTTWVYDVTVGLWHERASYGGGRHRSQCYVYAFDKHMVTDYENGNVYELDPLAYTDNGEQIVRTRRCPHLTADGVRTAIHSLTINFEGGVGNPDCIEPLLGLRYSDDGGHTWSEKMFASMGKSGEYNTRAVFRRLGISRDRVFEISVSDPVKVVILDADIQFTKGAS